MSFETCDDHKTANVPSQNKTPPNHCSIASVSPERRGSVTQIEATRRETAEKLSNPVIFWVTLADKYSGIVLMREPRLV